MHQSPRTWAPAESRARIEDIAQDRLGEGGTTPMAAVVDTIEDLMTASERLHDEEAFNLNPASNVLNPRAGSGRIRSTMAPTSCR